MYGKPQTQKLRKELKKKNIDLLLLKNFDLPQLDPNFYYFTRCNQFEGSIALLGKSSKLYVPEFEITRAERETWIKNIEKLPKSFKELAEELKGKRIAVNGNFLSSNYYNKLKKAKLRVIDFSKELEGLRVIKSKAEVACIRKAAKATKQIINSLNRKKPENELVADISCALASKGMKPSFDPIVAYDADSTIPHFEPCDKKGGKSLLIDMGALYKGYCSDVTRTFILDRNEKKLKEIYKIVEGAQKAAIESVKPGVKASKVHKVASDYMSRKGYKLIHSIGHGIGLEIHEKPYISSRSKDVLREGMVFTVEPGIYLKGKYGVRIEDDVLVTKKGCSVL